MANCLIAILFGVEPTVGVIRLIAILSIFPAAGLELVKGVWD